MDITIAERFRPFTHLPGKAMLLPGSGRVVTVYPTRLVIEFLGHLDFAFKGPINEFTAQLDLEKGCLNVWGQALNGYFRYRVHAAGEGVVCYAERLPEEGIAFQGLQSGTWLRGGFISLGNASSDLYQPAAIERLSLGVTKSQDWELVQRRVLPEEIAPFLIKLGQQLPETTAASGGTADLLNALKNSDKTTFYQAFQQFFSLAFEGVLNPTLEDKCHLGFALSQVNGGSPLSLVKEAARVIKSSLVDVSGNTISILAKVPPQFHCGRYTGVDCGELGSLDLEWTKKRARRLVFNALKSENIVFKLPPDERSFRLRCADTPTQGQNLSAGQSIPVEAGKTYFLDRFCK